MSEIFEIINYSDEIGVNPTICKQTWNCVCGKPSDGVKCGYPPAEAQAKVVEYYRRKAEWLEGLTPAEFLEAMGIYQQ